MDNRRTVNGVHGGAARTEVQRDQSWRRRSGDGKNQTIATCDFFAKRIVLFMALVLN